MLLNIWENIFYFEDAFTYLSSIFGVFPAKYRTVFTCYPSNIDIVFHFNQLFLFYINQRYIVIKTGGYVFTAKLLFIYIKSSRSTSY